MNFSGFLAKRYVFTRKRHSILTICSIATALTLMTMFFNMFSTYTTCLRAYTYDKTPYHCLVYSVTEEQCRLMAESEGIASCTLVKDTENRRYQAQIMLEEDVYKDKDILENAFKNAGLNISYYDAGIFFEFNQTLMDLDMVGVTAHANMAKTFAVFYIFLLFIIMMLRLVIDTAFEISSAERERWFGVLRSIGATTSQISAVIAKEGLMLSAVGIPAGILIGTAVSYGAYRMIMNSGLTDIFISPEKAEQLFSFDADPLFLLISAVTGLVWVLLSAYGTGMRIIKTDPVSAITRRKKTVKKVRRHTLLGFIFGWKGKLASRNTNREPMRFIITTLSLTLSIVLFSSFSYIAEKLQDTVDTILHDVGARYEFMLNNSTFYSTPKFAECVEILESSGYFKDIATSTTNMGSYYTEGKELYSEYVDIEYHNEESYNNLFNGAPPISYEELSASGKYLLIHNADQYDTHKYAQEIVKLNDIPLHIYQPEFLSENQYKALSPEEQEKCYEFPEEIHGKRYRRMCKKLYSYPVYTTVSTENTYLEVLYNYEDSSPLIFLIAPISQYNVNNNYGPYDNNYSIMFNLTEPHKYHEALEFLQNNETISEYTELTDLFIFITKIDSVVSLIKIISGFIIAIVSLVATVNMINIISTGILNRQGELAAMQCTGMTDRQLYAMTAVECAQYALTSGIDSMILCIMIVFGTKQILNIFELQGDYGDLISYTQPLISVLIASAVTFIIAFVTAYISLSGMKKQSLTDRIRSVE
ncbi:MAG: ABC transporter permease [Oscillospiraceae bacterium]|nr:ABC transporter permease [Oscillospiraceae bacterium]